MRRQPPKSGHRIALIDPLRAARVRLAIICAQYNREITRSLEAKCLDTFRAAGVRDKNVHRFSVPGCFEIPIVADRLARLGRYDALVALGAVIRGETHHFDLVAGECARGVMDVMLKHGVPIIFEVLATYRRRDALRRARNDRTNKGIEAAQSTLAILATLSQIRR
jgi:6,7-dimethyl-8-ribityllumazine synthase